MSFMKDKTALKKTVWMSSFETVDVLYLLIKVKGEPITLYTKDYNVL